MRRTVVPQHIAIQFGDLLAAMNVAQPILHNALQGFLGPHDMDHVNHRFRQCSMMIRLPRFDSVCRLLQLRKP